MTRRRLAAAVLAFAVAFVALAARAAAPVAAVGAIGMTVADLDRATAFYRDVLGFTPEPAVEVAGDDYEHLEGVFGLRMRVARLHLGRETIELTEYLAPRGRAMPADSRANDRWFQHAAIVVSDMDRAYRVLREHHVEHASSGPQRLPDWNPNAGGIRAFYFRDPDGHFLELIQFPPGKGDPRWQEPSQQIFLGIDHTAIAVEDTAASLAFYRDRLGLRVAGTSENSGTEQEHLNNVFGARLRITALRAAQGPGIELLEYLAPGDGRPRPADAHANDLLHWQTDVTAKDWGALPGSGNPVALPGKELGFGRGMLVADPDGHVLRVREE
jgi:catechol 2,3-dioxygenase-like lactoylglutathione lyase family enzyme